MRFRGLITGGTIEKRDFGIRFFRLFLFRFSRGACGRRQRDYRKEEKSRANNEELSFRATQDAAIREYEFIERLPDDYGQFLRRLSRIRSEDTKIGYAYRTLCRLYKRAAPEISASDTPREVQRKAERTARFASSDLESVRIIIERVKFEDAALAENEKFGLLGELCRSVRILL